TWRPWGPALRPSSHVQREIPRPWTERTAGGDGDCLDPALWLFSCAIVKRFTTAVVAALCLVAALATRPAGADAISAKKAEASRVAAQLDQLGQQAEVLAEQFNGARIKAGDAAGAAKKAATALTAADAAV